MDKWDENVDRIKNAALAEEPEAALAGALQLFAEFCRLMELISVDTDRIATALEGKPAEAEPPQPPAQPAEPQVHDL
jgi:hypothetical protein